MPRPANEIEFFTDDASEARVWVNARLNGTEIKVLRIGQYYTGTVKSLRSDETGPAGAERTFMSLELSKPDAT